MHQTTTEQTTDDKPGRIRHTSRLERTRKHTRREIVKVLYQQPRRNGEFPERLQQLVPVQQGG